MPVTRSHVPGDVMSPLAHKDHWERLLETWVPAPATLGVGSLGQGAGICIWRKLPRWFSCPGHAGHPMGSVPDEETQGRHRTMASHQADTQPSPPQSTFPPSVQPTGPRPATREHVPHDSYDDPGIEAPFKRGEASLGCPAEINKYCQSTLLQ